MTTLITGISHAVIYFNTIPGSKQSGVSAMVKLCFGSDEDAISQIMYRLKPGDKTPNWTLPTGREGDTPNDFPVFIGKMGAEILAAAGRTGDRVKKADLGKLAGRVFRVTSKSVEEIKDETAIKQS